MAKNNSKTEEVLDVVEEQKLEVMHLRLCDRRKSGFIMDLNGVEAGSKNTEHYLEFDSPLARFVPNFGYRRAYKEDTRGGKKVKVPYNEPIRYIKEQPEISVDTQKVMGIVPSRASVNDKIEFKRGEFAVVREGSYIGLFDYLRQSFYNKSNPDRKGTKANAIYEEIILDKAEEGLNEYDMYVADAVKFVGQFYQRGPKGYTYNEEKIVSLCEVFGIYAETNAGRVTALNGLAKIDPKDFLERAERFEQVSIAFVAQALQLNVIQITDGNLVSYLTKEKVLADLGSARLSRTNQIERLATLLETPEMKASKEDLMFEIELAKEKQLEK